jgi:hypothetical protein
MGLDGEASGEYIIMIMIFKIIYETQRGGRAALHSAATLEQGKGRHENRLLQILSAQRESV